MSKKAADLFDQILPLLDGADYSTGDVTAACLGVLYAGTSSIEDVKALQQIIAVTSASIAARVCAKLQEQADAKLN